MMKLQMLITIVKIHPFSMRIGPWECLWCVDSGFSIEKAVGLQNDEMFIWRATDFSVGQNEAGIKYNLFSHLRSMPELIQQQIEQLKKKLSNQDGTKIELISGKSHILSLKYRPNPTKFDRFQTFYSQQFPWFTPSRSVKGLPAIARRACGGLFKGIRG